MPTIFAFDMGLASLGVAVRKANEIIFAESLLFDADVGSISEQAERRKLYRMRAARKKRIEWLEKIWSEFELDGLLSSEDSRLKREFAKKNDPTIYTSSLLRIRLLQGETLEPWQIYKALRSSFRRRGYDRQLPWKTQADQKNKAGDKQSYEEKTLEFEADLNEMSSNPEHHFPCYYDAYIMGLWDPKTDQIKNHQEHETERVRRKYLPSREIVEKEVYCLLTKAGEQLDALKGREGYIMYGEAGKNFSPQVNETGKGKMRYASEKKHEGILAQKRPRFSNRQVSKCCLVARFQVCRADESLVIQVTYLMKLRNLTYYTPANQPEKLNVEDMQKLFQKAKDKLDEVKKKQTSPKVQLSPDKKSNCFKLTKTEWKNWLRKNKPGCTTNPANDEVEPSNIRGRSCFSKPGLVLMKDLLLSGKKPLDFRADTIRNLKKYEKFKLNGSDLGFLKDMENDWYKIHVPFTSLSRKYLQKGMNEEEGVKRLISSCRDPVVRHRTMVFMDKLRALRQEFGQPDKVVMEFIREDFMSEEKKKKLIEFQQEQEAINEEARKELKKLSIAQTASNPTKMQLLKQQNYRCPCTDDPLSPSQFKKYKIDHIVPQGGGWKGPDAIWNKVLTKKSTNNKKSGKAPFEFIDVSQWPSYEKRIKKTELSARTKKLLLARSRGEIEEYLNRWYGLAMTSWIARLAREVSCLYFGWQPGEKGEMKRFDVIPGGLTARVRRKQKLNELLGIPGEKGDSKNRGDKRHHALDAMVIAYLTQWHRNPRSGEFKFPKDIGNPKVYFKRKLNGVHPKKIAKSKNALGKAIYGGIKHPETKKVIAVRRKELLYYFKDCWESKDGNLKAMIRKKSEKIVDSSIREQIKDFSEQTGISGESFQNFLNGLKQSPKKGGSNVKKIRVETKTLRPLKNLSKKNLPGLRGQYLRSKSITGEGTKQHGYYFYKDNNGKIQAEPVYAFDSPYKKKEQIKNQGNSVLHDTLFYSGMLVEFKKKSQVATKTISKGIYMVKGCSENRLEIASKRGEKSLLSTKSALKAGMRPVSSVKTT